MAPRDDKVTPKVQRSITKTSTTKKPFLSSATVKKTMPTKKTVPQTPRKDNMALETRQRTYTAPTPQSKDSKPAACPGSVTKSAKKAWKRRPKPAHSGVPVPEKMKRILQQQQQHCSL